MRALMVMVMCNVFEVLVWVVSILKDIRKYGFNFLGGGYMVCGIRISGNRKYGLQAWSCISKVIVK